MIFLMTDFPQGNPVQGRQGAGQTVSGQESRHIGIRQGTGTGRHTDAEQAEPMPPHGLLHKVRQIARMLVHHLRLLQAAMTRLYLQDAPRLRNGPALAVHEHDRRRVAARVYTQVDRFPHRAVPVCIRMIRHNVNPADPASSCRGCRSQNAKKRRTQTPSPIPPPH